MRNPYDAVVSLWNHDRSNTYDGGGSGGKRVGAAGLKQDLVYTGFFKKKFCKKVCWNCLFALPGERLVPVLRQARDQAVGGAVPRLPLHGQRAGGGALRGPEGGRREGGGEVGETRQELGIYFPLKRTMRGGATVKISYAAVVAIATTPTAAAAASTPTKQQFC